jgi:hypothetical protein
MPFNQRRIVCDDAKMWRFFQDIVIYLMALAECAVRLSGIVIQKDAAPISCM